MSEGFLGRWSRRKLAAKEEEVTLPPEELEVREPLNKVGIDGSPPEGRQEVELLANSPGVKESDSFEASDDTVEELPTPTEEDLSSIQKTGNISSFLSEKVSQDLRNKAFKELFKIPSFNHVDMLDVYMEDFNKFTPLTVELRDKMALAKQLLKDPNEIETPDESLAEDDVSESIESPDEPMEVASSREDSEIVQQDNKPQSETQSGQLGSSQDKVPQPQQSSHGEG